jgi:hypothetical protein
VTAEMLTRCGIGKVKIFFLSCRELLTPGPNQVQIRTFFFRPQSMVSWFVVYYSERSFYLKG